MCGSIQTLKLHNARHLFTEKMTSGFLSYEKHQVQCLVIVNNWSGKSKVKSWHPSKWGCGNTLYKIKPRDKLPQLEIKGNSNYLYLSFYFLIFMAEPGVIGSILTGGSCFNNSIQF